MSPIRIRITADDLGWSEAVDGGIALAADTGVLCAVSVLATGPSLAHAVRAIGERPGVSLGLHFDLTDFRPAAPPDSIPSLVDRDGGFRRSTKRLALALLLGSARREHVQREMQAQLDRLGAAGIRVRHLDGHRHVHLLPRVSALPAAVARSAGLTYTRTVPRSSPRRVSQPARAGLAVLSRSLERNLVGTPTRVPTALAGLAESEAMGSDWIAAAVSRARPGLTELVTHPGLAESGTIGRAASHDRATDLAALRSPALRELVASGRIALDRED